MAHSLNLTLVAITTLVRSKLIRPPLGDACIACQATGRLDALAQRDEAVKSDGQRHQRGLFLGPDIGDRAWLFAMRGLPPQPGASRFQPGIQRGKVWEVRHALQHLVAGIPDFLLDLTPRQRSRTDGDSLARPSQLPDYRTPAHKHSGSSWRESAY